MSYLGPKHVAFIVVDAPEYPPLPQDWEQTLRRKIFNDPVGGADLGSYITTASYGRATLTGNVHGPFRITLPRDSNNNISYGAIIDLGIKAAKGQIEGYSYACIVATDNKLTDWAIYANFPKGYFYTNPDSTITDACTVDLNAPLGTWAMEVLHMVTRFGDLYGIPDSPGMYDEMACSCGVHPSSFPKLKFGWLAPNYIYNMPSRPSVRTIDVQALASPISVGGIRAIKISIPGSNNFYLVESRLPVDEYESGNPIFSAGLPGQGIVVYLIDESSWPPVHLRKESMNTAGDNFVDENYGINITVSGKLNSGFKVMVERMEPKECEALKDNIQDLIDEIQQLGQELEEEEDANRQVILRRQIREKQNLLYHLRTRAKTLGCNI